MLQLEELNARRKRATDEITRDAERLLQRDPTWQSHPVLVVQSEGWQAGVLGIVAAKLSEAHDRPAVVLVEEDGSCGARCALPKDSMLPERLRTARRCFGRTAAIAWREA
ncbi:MAG: DHHA1 domain-containing protein [Thermomicrobiales bacterium]